MPDRHYFAGLIPSNEALSQELLYLNGHLQEIINSLSVSTAPTLTAISVSFSRLGEAVTLLKGVTRVLPAEFNPSKRPRLQGSWLM